MLILILMKIDKIYLYHMDYYLKLIIYKKDAIDNRT